MRGKVYFIDTVHSILKERLSNFGFDCVDVTKTPSDEIINRIKDATGVVIRSKFTLSKEKIIQLPDLQFIARSGSGLENIDTVVCQERNIQLFNSPEGNRNAVAEHGVGMLLSLMNNIPKSNGEIRKGIWDREGNRGEEIAGKTIGIIGFGNNGAAFAKKWRGFDVKVMAYDKYKSGFGDHFVQECTLNAIQEQADIISFHVPQNRETIHLLNADFLNKCQKEIYVLNLSRGKIVDTAALVEGLENSKIKGACLDVLEYEKSSFEAFFDQEHTEELRYILHSDRVVLSPHVAGWTKESYFKLSNVLADKIIAHYSE
ncbi:MAG: NAD(P)-dependent oxidoreductase [Crocinitomicaceae bacterium]|jgi:D-3-phosphoglycerate dehydrogenase